jgi:hypothetical protein
MNFWPQSAHMYTELPLTKMVSGEWHTGQGGVVGRMGVYREAVSTRTHEQIMNGTIKQQTHGWMRWMLRATRRLPS